MKITKEQIKEIRKLRKEGKLIREIAKKFNVNMGTILYHLDDDYRLRANKRSKEHWDKIPKKVKKELYKKRASYQAEYNRKRYQNDPKWREKIKKISREWYRKNKSKQKI